jgi:tRNA (Thr-GGU) A37 N-methylase
LPATEARSRCLDNTPLVDLKPYFASTDAEPEAVVGWHGKSKV